MNELTFEDLKHTNWGIRILVAEERLARESNGNTVFSDCYPFTWRDVDASNSWTTCACGAQDPRIPRVSGGQPEDTVLADAGISFYDAIRYGAVSEAKRLLCVIEKRAREVLEEVLA